MPYVRVRVKMEVFRLSRYFNHVIKTQMSILQKFDGSLPKAQKLF